MCRMVLDPMHLRPAIGRGQAQRLSDGVWNVADTAIVRSAVGHESASRAVAKRKPSLPPQVGSRVARDGYVIDVLRLDAAHFETHPHRLFREAGDVLHASKPLFFDGGDQ